MTFSKAHRHIHTEKQTATPTHTSTLLCTHNTRTVPRAIPLRSTTALVIQAHVHYIRVSVAVLQKDSLREKIKIPNSLPYSRTKKNISPSLTTP